MELKLIKTKYGGKCNKCNRELKPDWTVYFSPETKALYCKQCGEVLINGKEPIDIPENIDVIATIGDLSLQLMHFNTHMQVVHSDSKSIREKLDKIIEMLQPVVPTEKKKKSK